MECFKNYGFWMRNLRGDFLFLATNKHEFVLAGLVFSASSALKVNFVTEHCLRPQAAWPPQLRFKPTKFISHGLATATPFGLIR